MKHADPDKEFEEIMREHPELMPPMIQPLKEYLKEKELLIQRYPNISAKVFGKLLTTLMNKCFDKALTEDEREFLRIIHEEPRPDLERRLERLGLLDSFRRAEEGV